MGLPAPPGSARLVRDALRPGAPVGVQFDVDLGYVVVWALEGEPRCGEHGDWGAGLDAQGGTAPEHLLVRVAG